LNRISILPLKMSHLNFLSKNLGSWIRHESSSIHHHHSCVGPVFRGCSVSTTRKPTSCPVTVSLSVKTENSEVGGEEYYQGHRRNNFRGRKVVFGCPKGVIGYTGGEAVVVSRTHIIVCAAHLSHGAPRGVGHEILSQLFDITGSPRLTSSTNTRL
jgi:hypothetical protein